MGINRCVDRRAVAESVSDDAVIALMPSLNPRKGRTNNPSPPPMRVLHRFTKLGHVAEIRELIVSQFRAIEFLICVDGSVLVSQFFHSGRQVDYPKELAIRIAQFVEAGWVEEHVNEVPVS